MGYHQLSYLLGFLPLVLLLFSICPKRSRRYVLAGASWLYFFLCSRYLIVYLLGTTVWAYLMGIWIGKLGEGLPESVAAASREPYRKQAMAHHAVMLLANGVLFGVLFYLKYTGFFVRQLNKLVVHAGGAARQGCLCRSVYPSIRLKRWDIFSRSTGEEFRRTGISSGLRFSWGSFRRRWKDRLHATEILRCSFPAFRRRRK